MPEQLPEQNQGLVHRVAQKLGELAGRGRPDGVSEEVWDRASRAEQHMIRSVVNHGAKHFTVLGSAERQLTNYMRQENNGE